MSTRRSFFKALLGAAMASPAVVKAIQDGPSAMTAGRAWLSDREDLSDFIEHLETDDFGSQALHLGVTLYEGELGAVTLFPQADNIQ